MGDFNTRINVLSNSNHSNSKWFDVMEDFNLSQMVTFPTRVTKTLETFIMYIQVIPVMFLVFLIYA